MRSYPYSSRNHGEKEPEECRNSAQTENTEVAYRVYRYGVVVPKPRKYGFLLRTKQRQKTINHSTAQAAGITMPLIIAVVSIVANSCGCCGYLFKARRSVIFSFHHFRCIIW